MESKRYIIQGVPIPLMRTRKTATRVYDPQKDIKERLGWEIAAQHHLPMYTGPLRLEVEFYFPMAKSLSKKHSEMIGTYHVYKPDLSNLIKLVEDVVQGIIYKDDCIIAQINATKTYSNEPRTEFTITPLISIPTPEQVAQKVRRQIGGRHHTGSTR